jgi:hypothetical protein
VELPVNVLPVGPETRADADRVLRTLRGVQAARDYQLGCWLRCGARLEVHRIYGYASFREYVERVFGFRGRTTEERLRVAEALESLPHIAEVFRSGQLVYSVVRELTRVANADTEEEWVAHVGARTAREVEQLVSGRVPGDRPEDPVRPEAERTRITLVVNESNAALLREARKAATMLSGEAIDDDAFVAFLARAVLSQGGARDEGTSSYRIALTVCEECGAATQEAGGHVDDATVEMARCDAQEIGRVDGRTGELGRATQTIPPKVRRAVMHRHGGRCAVPGCSNRVFLDEHHIDLRSEGGSHHPNRLIVLCAAHHRAAHDGRLIVRGDAARGFVFEHADGSEYGSPRNDAALAGVLGEVFGMLCAMGFRQKEARSMIDAARRDLSPEAGLEAAMRRALTASSFVGVREDRAFYAPRSPTWEYA